MGHVDDVVRDGNRDAPCVAKGSLQLRQLSPVALVDPHLGMIGCARPDANRQKVSMALIGRGEARNGSRERF